MAVPELRIVRGADNMVLIAPGMAWEPDAALFDPEFLRREGWLDAEWPAGRGMIRRLRVPPDMVAETLDSALDSARLAPTFNTGGSGGYWSLRHYWRGGWIGRGLVDRYLYTGLTRTRPWRELQLLAAMRAEGLPVPVPIAGRVRLSPPWYRADLLTQWLEGTESVDARLRRSRLDAQDWERIGACIRRFHEAGYYHADLNSRNILLGSDAVVWILDWDRGQKRSPGAWQQANLRRLQHDLNKRWQRGSFPYYAETDFLTLLAGYQVEGNRSAQ